MFTYSLGIHDNVSHMKRVNKNAIMEMQPTILLRNMKLQQKPMFDVPKF